MVWARLSLMVSWLVLAAACMSSPAPDDFASHDGFSYEYLPGPFCGRCYAKKIFISPSGRVHIEESRRSDNDGNGNPRRWIVRRSPETAAAFVAVFSSLQPLSGPIGTATRLPCGRWATDHPEVRMSWSEGGEVRELFYDFGCKDDDREQIGMTVADAPDILGIGKRGLPYRRSVED